MFAVIVTKPLPTPADAVFAACAKISEACNPSRRSASSPELAPSLVISKKPRARMSAAVWSAVAPTSIPSNFDPSAATSRPSTSPETIMLPLTVISSKVSITVLYTEPSEVEIDNVLLLVAQVTPETPATAAVFADVIRPSSSTTRTGTCDDEP